MKNGFFVISVLACSYLIYTLFFYENSVWNYYEKKDSLFGLEQKILEVEAENRELELFYQAMGEKIHPEADLLLEVGYIKKNETIIDIKPPQIIRNDKNFLSQDSYIPLSVIIFFSCLTLFFIVFLSLKYQRKLIAPNYSTNIADA